MASPTLVAAGGQAIGVTGKTISINVNAGEVLFAFISKGGTDVPTCTWNGGAMTSVLENNTQGRHQTLFMLSSPTTGTHNVVFTTTQVFGTVSAWTVSGANASPIGQSNVTQNATSTTVSGSVTLTYNNSMMVICTFIDNTPTVTTGAGQTDIYKVAEIAGQTGAASYKVPGSAGSNTMSYTLSTSNDWEPIIFEIVATTPITPSPSNGAFIMNLI